MQNVKANLVGVAIGAVPIAVISLFVPNAEVPKPTWFFAFVLWVACALFAWNHKLAPVKPRGWLLMSLASIPAAGLWFGIARGASHLVFGEGESGLSAFFDVGVALMLAPGLTSIAFAGWARTLFNTLPRP